MPCRRAQARTCMPGRGGAARLRGGQRPPPDNFTADTQHPMENPPLWEKPIAMTWKSGARNQCEVGVKVWSNVPPQGTTCRQYWRGGRARHRLCGRAPYR